VCVPHVSWRVGEGNKALSSALNGENGENRHSINVSTLRSHPAVNYPVGRKKM
jgi:hypothetical protein